jgi:hypothetical protein
LGVLQVSPTGVPRKNRRKRELLLPAVTDLDIQEKRKRFFQLWSNPLEWRGEKELAQELDVPTVQLEVWKKDPEFFIPATRIYQQQFRANFVPICRRIIATLEANNSLQAARLLLEMLGMVEGRGSKLNLTINAGPGGGDGGGSTVQRLTDAELDAEIQRLFLVTAPADIDTSLSKVQPIEDAQIEDGEFEDGIRDEVPGLRGVESEEPAREAVPAAAGEEA